MATVRRPVAAPPVRASMERPRPGPAPGAPAGGRDYTQPPPGGAHYPWEPGGGSKVPGVPDNWRDFYPSEQEGRGDAWIGPKKAQLNAEHPPSSYQNMPSARSRMSPDEFRKWQTNQIFTGDTWPTNNRSPSGQPGPNWDPRNPPPGSPSIPDWFRQHPDPLAGQGAPGRSPGPPAPPGTAIHKPGQPAPGTGPGSAQAWNRLGAASQKAAAPAAAVDYGKIRSGMKPGQTVKQGGKSYFLNQNGALVDVTNPAARKRITDRQGNLIGQAAAPPPPTQAPAAAAPPAATAGGGVDPQQFAQMQQQFQQMQQQLQQYQQGGGGMGGGSYSGMPTQFSGFGDALMQGMGGGYGGWGGMGSGNEVSQMQGMMPQMQDYMQSMMGGMGGYGGGLSSLPQQVQGFSGLQMNPYARGDYGMSMGGGYGDPYGGMGGYGGGYDPYGGMGFDPNMMNQSLMGYF